MSISAIDLTGKVALVTGGSKGLGYAMAQGLAQFGANVSIASRNQQEIEQAAKEIAQATSRKVVGFTCDVSKKAQVGALVENTVNALGKIDILINNAGIAAPKLLLKVNEEDWYKILDINLKGDFLVAQSVAKQMIKQGAGGKIINVSSALAVKPEVAGGLYCTAKAGLQHLTRVMAIEWAEHGILVNCLCPGYFHTPMTDSLINDPKIYKYILSKTVINRLGALDEIVGPAVFLASDWSNLMTGTALFADGGWATK